ncbi:MAG: GvpL/GvpF family gas vesicle protein [Caulobacteraceae bacterium]|nr:GvpL/GvpF family gas vesicle protein [Caulobacteraceae bacterium]
MSCAETQTRAQAADQEVVNLFAFVDTGRQLTWRGLETGAAEPPPTLHVSGGIAAVIGMVPLDDYCGAEAARNLADVEWLAPRAGRHAAILREAMLEATVFPAPFGTLFASLDSLTGFMATHEAAIRGFLEDVADKQEWGIKVAARLDDHDLLEAQAAKTWPDWAALTPGVRYMRLCRDRPKLMSLARSQMADDAAAAVGSLAPPAVAVRRLEGARASGDGSEHLIASFALLAPKADGATLGEAAGKLGATLAPLGMAISMTGPWPPFSFRPDLHPPPNEP